MSHLVYRPKPPYPRWIRLVQLLPVKEGSPEKFSTEQPPQSPAVTSTTISCVLIDVPFDDEGLALPPYTALSYCWGAPHPSQTIVLNGIHVQVGENLEAALQQLRHKDESRLLWVDALCINQEDNEEKEAQVRIMSQIFRRAMSVIAWIGSEQSGTKLVMDWIARSSGLMANIEHPLYDKHKDLKQALLQLFSCPYWSRIWIIQELVNAKDLVYQCGDITVTEAQLRKAVDLLREIKGEFWDQCRNTQNVTMLRTHTGKPILIYLLRQFRQYHATLREDKVFALLGLARDMNNILPNYSLPCQVSYMALARALIDEGYIEILSLCEARRPAHDDIVLPSWVPDWSRKGIRDPLQQRELERGTIPLCARLEPVYNACGQREWTATAERENRHVNAGRQDVLLQLEVIFIGQVKRQGNDWVDHAGKWIHSILELADRSTKEANAKQRFKAALRTAVADQQLRARNADGLKLRMEEQLLSDVFSKLRGRNLRNLSNGAFWDLGIGDFYQQVWCLAWGRRPFTAADYIGLGPAEAQVGDCLCLVRGSGIPYVVRRGQAKTYQLIGEAYVDGCMDGELPDGHLQSEFIVLV